MAEKRVYEFGPFRIDSVERLLYRGEELIPLAPKTIDTLMALVSNAGRVLEKDDLIRMVWRDSFVEEGGIARNISLLRKALGDTEEGRYIETIPKRGYRFVAPLRDPIALQSDPAATPAPAIHRRRALWPAALILSAAALAAALWFATGETPGEPAQVVSVPASALAVMPFKNVSGDPSQDYFAEGMTHALITDLAKMGNLRVISLASPAGGQSEPAALAAIVKDDSAGLVVRGTILKSGERIRIDAQLIDPHKRTVYWANSYDRGVKDVLALQADVADAIAHEIQAGINSRRREQVRPHRAVKPEALDAHMRGRYLWNRRTEEGLREAVRHFQQAIASDPEYAVAHAALADSYSLLGSVGIDGMPPAEAMPLAKAAAQKALELDPTLAEGYVSRAYIKLSYDWDLPGAAKDFSRALALNPASATGHHWYSHYFMAAGDLDKATQEMNAALSLEPLSSIINVGAGWCHYYSRRYDEAIERYKAVIEMDPNYAVAHQTLAMAYQQKGMFPEAITHFKRAVSLSGDGPSAIAGLASAYGAAGMAGEARKELARLTEMSRRRYVPALYFAAVHEALGETASSFRWGWKALGERSDYFVYLRVEPRAGRLHNHPEFLKMLSRLHP
jgi:TolB-like protein/DNA-binding winged helix-turn-helix (wHTH) protein/Tfp pilus assembly protein PilF